VFIVRTGDTFQECVRKVNVGWEAVERSWLLLGNAERIL
jgi:hypothetical protein